MDRLRHHSALAAWLTLGAIVLGGGLIATHSHDGLSSGKLDSIALSGGHNHFATTAHVESPTSIEDEFCPACAARQRQGVLDASQPSSRSRVKVMRGVRPTGDLAIFGSEVGPSAPRGPPTV